MKGTQTQRIRMAELSMSGVFHAAVNAGFVRWMQAEYPDAEIRFFAERSHAEVCRQKLENQSIIIRKWPWFPPAHKYTLPVRDALGCLYVFWLLVTSRKSDILFITNLLPFTHWILFGWNKLFRRTLFIALHGQLEALLPGSPAGLTKPCFRLHGPLLRRDRHSRYIVLGAPVFEAAKGLFGAETQVIVIDHPHESDEHPVVPPDGFPLRFGQIGVGNRGKGTERLFRLGELLRGEVEAGKIELHLVGALDRELRRCANPWVEWHEKPLSELDFQLAVSELHCALFLRDADTGRAVPSGSFFDAVRHHKPFLSLRHPFVEHYAARFPGRGRFCVSVEEMADVIRKMVETC